MWLQWILQQQQLYQNWIQHFHVKRGTKNGSGYTAAYYGCIMYVEINHRKQHTCIWTAAKGHREEIVELVIEFRCDSDLFQSTTGEARRHGAPNSFPPFIFDVGYGIVEGSGKCVFLWRREQRRFWQMCRAVLCHPPTSHVIYLWTRCSENIAFFFKK